LFISTTPKNFIKYYCDIDIVHECILVVAF